MIYWGKKERENSAKPTLEMDIKTGNMFVFHTLQSTGQYLK